MPFDPFGIEAYHESVRQKIAADEPGYAQSEIHDGSKDVTVSFEKGALTYSGLYDENNTNKIIDEIIINVARDEGLASKQTFREFRIHFMIKDRRAYPPHWKRKHKEADLLRVYYLESDEGRRKLIVDE